MTETRQTDAKQKDTQARKRKPPVAKMAAPAAPVLDPAMVQLALVDPASAPQASILHLQRNSGNRAVQRLIERTTQRDSTAQPASSKDAIQPHSQVVQRETTSPTWTPTAFQRKTSTRPGKSANVHPNRSMLPKAVDINRPKSWALPIIQMNPEAVPLAGETEAGFEIEMDGAYVPPVAPPPGLPKGKPNKGRLLIQAKLTVGPANDRYEQEADKVADRLRRTTDQDLAGVSPQQAAETTPVQRAHFTISRGRAAQQRVHS